MNGKGDKRRPEDRTKIDTNWDRIFKSGSSNTYKVEKKETLKSTKEDEQGK